MCSTHVENLLMLFISNCELMGARVRIIVGMTHLLVVERSYPKYCTHSNYTKSGLVSTNIYRGKLRCKLSQLFFFVFVQSTRSSVQFTHSIPYIIANIGDILSIEVANRGYDMNSRPRLPCYPQRSLSVERQLYHNILSVHYALLTYLIDLSVFQFSTLMPLCCCRPYMATQSPSKLCVPIGPLRWYFGGYRPSKTIHQTRSLF